MMRFRLLTQTFTMVVILMAFLIATAQTESKQMPEKMAESNGCFECHSTNKRAPTFQVITQMYKDKAGARDALIEVIKNGGKGNWTQVSRGVPMPPYSGRLSDSEIQNLVDWVLSQ